MAKQAINSALEGAERPDDVKIGSNRSFGIVFAIVFAIVGLLPLWSGAPLRLWSLAVGAGFLAIALVLPSLLAPLNRLWFKFGLLLSKITSPIVMGLVFYLTVTPTALIMRMLGKDPLRLKLDRDAPTYWISRTPPGPDPDSIKNQF